MGDFTRELRRATREPHSLSDRLVNSKLVFALSDESVWADALLIFYEVFKHLEKYKEDLKMPELDKLFVNDALMRTSGFEKDLERYLGRNWKKSYVMRREVSEYVAHLQELKEERPLLLLAYVYHLYMGLLSGGQIIRTKRQISFTSFVSDSSNTSAKERIDWVVEFPDCNISDLKKAMKQAMNEIAAGLTQEQKCALLNESKFVFLNNISIIRTVKGTNKAIFRKLVIVALVAQIAVLAYLYFHS